MDLLEHCNRLTEPVEISPLGQAICSPPEQKQLSTSIRHVLSCLSLRGSLPISGVGTPSVPLRISSTYHIIHKTRLFADS